MYGFYLFSFSEELKMRYMIIKKPSINHNNNIIKQQIYKTYERKRQEYI